MSKLKLNSGMISVRGDCPHWGQEVLAHEGDSIEGKLIAVSGYGNAGWGIMKTAMQPGAMVIAASFVKYDIEVANMLTTNDARELLRAQKNIIVAPAKAINAGGVGVSALEMEQNSERLVWTAEEVVAQPKKTIHDESAKACETYGLGYNLVAGTNIDFSRKRPTRWWRKVSSDVAAARGDGRKARDAAE